MRIGARSRCGGIVVGLLLWLPAAATAAAPAVTNNSDSGLGSLRAAIADASAGDTITIPAGIGTIALSTGPLAISESLTITGAGQSATTISGGGTHQIFNITGASSNVSLSNMTLTDGGGVTAGAAIDTAGPLTLTDITVSGSTSNGFGNVYSQGTSLSITGSTFTHNSTFLASSAANRGAAVDLEPSMTANGQSVSLQIDGSTFSDNTAGGNASYPGSGGAVAFVPDATGTASNTTSTMSVTNSTFTGDRAGNGGYSSGGAIFFSPSDAAGGSKNAFDLTLGGDTFTNEQVEGGATAGATAAGGAVAIAPLFRGANDSDTTNVTNGTFSSDTAGSATTTQDYGGAIALVPSVFGTGVTNTLTITGGGFDHNTTVAGNGESAGGAICVTTGSGSVVVGATSVTVSGATFTDNGADSGASSYTESGGGIYFEPAETATESSSLDVTSSDFEGNTAGTNAVGRGGAINFLVLGNGAGDQRLNLESDTFHANTAGGTAGAGDGGAVYADGVVATSHEVISDSTFAGNSTSAGNVLGYGGGLSIETASIPNGSTTLTNDSFTGNRAGGPATTGASAGGGVFVRTPAQGSISLVNNTITANTASGNAAAGGGVSGPASVSFANTIAAGNTAATGADCGAATTASAGGNIETATSCGFTAAGDHQNTDPKLGPLADNGGGVQTLLPQPDSPALGAGVAQLCPSTDERGLARPANAGCDSGAVEVQRGSVTTGAATAVTSTTATIGGSAAPGEVAGTVTIQYGTTTAYGGTSPGTTLAARAASTPFSIKLTGLTPGTTYHYRAVLSGSGTLTGGDATFTTPGSPKNTKRPKITGKAKVGKTLRCSRGSWTGTPTRFAYTWKRNGKKIKGATKAKHRVSRKDRGKKLSCTVTARNAVGTGTATSKPVRVKRAG